MTKYTITPWRTQADLLEVRQQLYSVREPGVDSPQHAVDRIMAWKLRGNLPHAVESTALLVDAILHHNIKANSIFSIRAVYSAAFCRFVTGFCDIGRHKERTLEPSSMLEIAKQIDMPAEFVALRHEATHEELPGVQRLVIATQQALEWLWRVYWSRLDVPDDVKAGSEALLAFRADAVTSLRSFRRSRRDALRSNLQNSPEQLAELARTCDGLVDACRGSRSRTKALTHALVEERLMLPANREMGASLEGAFLIWNDVFRNFSKRLSGFLRMLLLALLESIAKPAIIAPETDIEKEAHVIWLLHILDSDIADQKERDSMLADVVELCCLHPGYWTRRIGSEVLERGDSDLQADWRDLFYASSIEATESEVIKAVRPEKDLASELHTSSEQQLMDSDQRQPDSQEDDSLGRWRRAVTSPSIPLGMLQLNSSR